MSKKLERTYPYIISVIITCIYLLFVDLNIFYNKNQKPRIFKDFIRKCRNGQVINNFPTPPVTLFYCQNRYSFDVIFSPDSDGSVSICESPPCSGLDSVSTPLTANFSTKISIVGIDEFLLMDVKCITSAFRISSLIASYSPEAKLTRFFLSPFSRSLRQILPPLYTS